MFDSVSGMSSPQKSIPPWVIGTVGALAIYLWVNKSKGAETAVPNPESNFQRFRARMSAMSIPELTAFVSQFKVRLGRIRAGVARKSRHQKLSPDLQKRLDRVNRKYLIALSILNARRAA